jgi:molybdopterin converting factor small subunit
MNDEKFTLSYMKCQETFIIDVMRRCLEAEAKISLLNDSLKAKDTSIREETDKNFTLSEQVTQLLAGLEATTIQRDTYRDEHARYRDEIIALGDLKEKCDKIEKNYEEHMKNYNLVNDAYQKLQVEYQTLLDSQQKVSSEEKKVNKKKDDWS